MYQPNDEIDVDELRSRLLSDAYAGAFSGLGAMILDVSEIQNAGEEELIKMARRAGMI